MECFLISRVVLGPAFTYLFICLWAFLCYHWHWTNENLRDSNKVNEIFFLLQRMQQTHFKGWLFFVPRWTHTAGNKIAFYFQSSVCQFCHVDVHPVKTKKFIESYILPSSSFDLTGPKMRRWVGCYWLPYSASSSLPSSLALWQNKREEGEARTGINLWETLKADFVQGHSGFSGIIHCWESLIDPFLYVGTCFC